MGDEVFLVRVSRHGSFAIKVSSPGEGSRKRLDVDVDVVMSGV